jgi:hypothetical protein
VGEADRGREKLLTPAIQPIIQLWRQGQTAALLGMDADMAGNRFCR